jgi:hypothetical protein
MVTSWASHYGFEDCAVVCKDSAFVRAAVLKGAEKAHAALDFFKSFAKRFEGYKISANELMIIIWAQMGAISESREVGAAFRAGSLGDVGSRKGRGTVPAMWEVEVAMPEFSGEGMEDTESFVMPYTEELRKCTRESKLRTRSSALESNR